MSDDLLNLNEWVSTWQMKINFNKCELLALGYNNPRFPYKLGDFTVNSHACCRDLGIHMSNDLSFTLHCSKITRSAHFRRRQFQQSFACKDRNLHVFLFSTYIRPILESNSVIWSPHTLGDIDKIESVQRKFTKFLPGLFNVPYMNRLEIVGLESLEIRRIKLDLVFMYKILNGLVDLNHEDYLTFNENSTRGHDFKINVQYSRVNCRKYFFINRTIPIWNSLDANIVNSDTVFEFKRKLNSFDATNYCRGRAYRAI